jgi:N-acetylmuramoyl-L-alanine amidase
MIPLKIYAAAEWGAKPVSATFSTQAARGIVVHHAVFPNRAPLTGEAELQAAFAVARQIQALHLARGWVDTGNHFTVSRGGVLMEGRHGSLAAAQQGDVVRGAHAGVNAINAAWFGIENEGTYTTEWVMTAEQWGALVELCAWLAFWGRFDSQNIQPHSYFRPTQCPGLLREHIQELRAAVHQRKAQIRAG